MPRNSDNLGGAFCDRGCGKIFPPGRYHEKQSHICGVQYHEEEEEKTEEVSDLPRIPLRWQKALIEYGEIRADELA